MEFWGDGYRESIWTAMQDDKLLIRLVDRVIAEVWALVAEIGQADPLGSRAGEMERVKLRGSIAGPCDA